jgi:hypothetical protein
VLERIGFTTFKGTAKAVEKYLLGLLKTAAMICLLVTLLVAAV